MAADHSARGSMKTGVKPETVCELQDTNDHRQVERKWRLPISVGKLSALEGRFAESNLIGNGRFVVVFVFGVGVVSRHSWPSTIYWLRTCPDTYPCIQIVFQNTCISTSGVLDHALNLSISLSAGKETKWDSHSNGE